MQPVTRLTPRWYDGLAFTFLSDRHYVLIIREEHGMSNEVTKGLLSMILTCQLSSRMLYERNGLLLIVLSYQTS